MALAAAGFECRLHMKIQYLFTQEELGISATLKFDKK